MNKRSVKWLEQDLLSFFNELENAMPGLHTLTLGVNKSCATGKVVVNGFYHVNKDCTMVSSIDELFAIWKQHQILYQRFEGWGINEVNK